MTSRPCKADFAGQRRSQVEIHARRAEEINVAMDKLSTRALSSLYAANPPAEARRLPDRLDVVQTPGHGSWLNRAEIEFRVMERQALKGRVPDAKALSRRVKAWASARDLRWRSIDWKLPADAARVKLHRLSPQLETWRGTRTAEIPIGGSPVHGSPPALRVYDTASRSCLNC